VFHDSVEVQAEMFWTGDLPQQFRARRGYSVIKYLPVLHNWHDSSFNPLNLANFSPLPPPDYDFTGGVGQRVRSDFARTLTDLYVDRYVRGMNDWAHSRGLHSRQEVSYNYKQLDVIRAAAAVDVPETETFDLNWGRAYDSTLPEYPTDRWRYGVDGYRLTASGAHLAGRDRVTAEWADDFAIWRKGPKEMADLMNAAIAGGVTQPSFAGFGGVNDAAWPTPTGLSFIGFGDTLQTNWPQWRDFGPLMTYIARSTVLVESGEPRVDVTVYHDAGLSSLRDVNTPLWRGRALAKSGYTYDFVDPVSLASTRLSDTYRALIIDNQSAMAPAAAVALLRYALRGLPVVIVGAVPSRSSGLLGDGATRIAMAALVHLRNVARVAGEDDVPAALARLDVDPDVAFGGSDLQTVHRHTASGDVWWLYNPTDAPIATRGNFAASGQPYLLDLWNGTTTTAAEFSERAGRTSLPVAVPAHGSIGIAFRGRAGVHATSSTAAEVVHGDRGTLVARDVVGGVKSVTLSSGRTTKVRLATLPAPLALADWHLDVDEISPAGHTPHSLDLHGLRDWQTIPELHSAVGSSVYSARVSVPASWLGSGREVELDLGAFVGAVRLTVNGTVATEQTTPGAVVPVTELLRPGLNTIAVRLDTTLLNRNAQLRAHTRPARSRRSASSSRHRSARSRTACSGRRGSSLWRPARCAERQLGCARSGPTARGFLVS
jgi:alpha-L-rhamnosidase